MTKQQKQWIKELATTTKLQGGFQLRDKKAGKELFCVLGIARELFGSWEDKSDHSATCLSDELTKQLRLNDPLGSFKEPYNLNGIRFHSLAMMNDKGFTFKELAGYMQQHSENVFNED